LTRVHYLKFRGFLDALLADSYNRQFAAMSKFLWGSSSRNQPSQSRFIAYILPIILFLLLAGPARPLVAKVSRAPLTASQNGEASASQSASATSGITGRVVDSATHAPISGGQVTVALEQPDGTGTDSVFTQASPDGSGHFSFNRLPLATTYDLIAIAINGNGVAYDATIIVGIPPGSDLGDVPIIAETGDARGPGKIEGLVTATSGTAPSSIRATISAIQTIDLRHGISIPVDVPLTVAISGADYRPVTIPGEPGTSANIFLRSRTDCPASVSANVNCGKYVIVVPGSNPSVARFERGSLSYHSQAGGPARYSVRANAYMPYGLGSSLCIPSFQSANADMEGQPLKVSPGGTATAQPIAFTGCW
jgi:hypothetical protein